jgi:hypothetical protein
MLPNFLIIGAPRSGTTWIEKNLRKHPDIFISPKKELHFFDLHYDQGIAQYESNFAGWSGQKAIGEATPDYLHGAYTKNDIPALIRQHLPAVKMIASLRNPVDRAYSRFWHSKARFDRNRDLTFEQKLADRPEFLAEGFYSDHLSRYYQLFPREALLVLLYDDLLTDPVKYMARIYDFLGVDSDFRSGLETVNFNASAGKGNLARMRPLWYLSRLLAQMGLHDTATRLRLVNSVEIPPMTADIRRALIGVYKEKNLTLQALIGRDLAGWNQVDTVTAEKLASAP